MNKTFEQDKELLESTNDVDVLQELADKYIYSSIDEESQLGLQAANKWIEINDNYWPHLYVGDYHFSREEYKESFVEYKTANDMQEYYIALSFLSILYFMGYGETNTMDLENGVKCAKRAIDIYEKHREKRFPKRAYFVMGNAYLEEYFYENKIDKCEKYFLEILKNVKEQDDLLAGTHNNLGKYYLYKKRYDDAKEHFQKSLEIYEIIGWDTIIQQFNIAVCDEQIGNIDAASNSFFRIFDEYQKNYAYLFETPYEDLKPRERDLLRIFGLVCYECGHIYEDLKDDDDKAEYYYLEGLKSQHSLCYTILSAFYEKRGLQEKADDVLFEAINTVKDNDAYLLNDIGGYFYDKMRETGDPAMRDLAITFYTRSSELGLATAYLNLGKIYEFYSEDQEATAVKYYRLAEKHGESEGGLFKNELLKYMKVNRRKFEELIAKLRERNLSPEDLKESIGVEIVWFFGPIFSRIPNYVIDELVLGIYSYIQLLETKKDIDKIDFSLSVNPISKATEKLLDEKIASPYIDFLTKNGYEVSLSTVGQPFIHKDKKTGETHFGFADGFFSLGQLERAIIKREKNKHGENIINTYPSFIDFLTSTWPKISRDEANAFARELSRQATTFKDYRNDASHKDPISRSRAEQAFIFLLYNGNIIRYLIQAEKDYKEK